MNPRLLPTRQALTLYDDNGNGRITCAEARAHGIAPVRRGHPAYQYMNDAQNMAAVRTHRARAVQERRRMSCWIPITTEIPRHAQTTVHGSVSPANPDCMLRPIPDGSCTAHRDPDTAGNRSAHPHPYSDGNLESHCDAHPCANAAVGATFELVARDHTVAPENRCSPYDADEYRYSPSVEPRIVEAQGGIYGPYTGTWFATIKETDIEHIVARSEAHDSGLCAASPATWSEFASDLLNLTLASPSVSPNPPMDGLGDSP